MGRRKIEIKAIKDDRNRSVTFLKRKAGLFKKAHELSVLCSVDVAVIIFGNNKKLYEYSSADINDTITRFSYYNGPHEHKGPADYGGELEEDDDEEDFGMTMGQPGSRPGSIPPSLPNGQQYPHPQHVRAVSGHQGYMRGSTATPPPPIAPGMQNYHGAGAPPRQHTPQPHMMPISRPGSGQAMRRPTSTTGMAHAHLQPHVAQQHQHQFQSQHGLHPRHAPPPQHPSQMPNGYTYMRGTPHNGAAPPASMYQQGSPGQSMHSREGPPPAAAARGTHQSAETIAYYNQLQQAAHQQSYMPEERQMTPGMSPPPQPNQAPMVEDQHISRLKKSGAKGRSIFTPIDDSRSLLAQHWSTGRSNIDPDIEKAEAEQKAEMMKQKGKTETSKKKKQSSTKKDQDVENTSKAEKGQSTESKEDQRNKSPPSLGIDTASKPSAAKTTRSSNKRSAAGDVSASSTRSDGAKRPKLKVHIPEEQSDAEDDEGESASASASASAAQTTTGASTSEGTKKSNAGKGRKGNATTSAGRSSASTSAHTTRSTVTRAASAAAAAGAAENEGNDAEARKPKKGANAKSDQTAGSTITQPSGRPVRLPPPSPSNATLLSAGAAGPPNPFARPLPPAQSSGVNGSKNDAKGLAESDRRSKTAGAAETPISALPSRFVADGLLPSPSAFYPDWSLGRMGGDSAILPSPLTFQTPIGPATAHPFKDDTKAKDDDKADRPPPPPPVVVSEAVSEDRGNEQKTAETTKRDEDGASSKQTESISSTNKDSQAVNEKGTVEKGNV